MENLEIDNKHLFKIAESIEFFQESLQEDVDLLKNKDGDNFDRYMAFCRIMPLLSILPYLIESNKMSVYLGHSIHEEIFQTEKAEKNGWDTSKIEYNPFFITEKNKKNNDEDMPDALKKFLAKVILKAMKEKVNDD